MGFDGKDFKTWNEFNDSSSLKKNLVQRLSTNGKVFNLTDLEATHLFAIITKYKKNKYSLKNKVNFSLIGKVIGFYN